jgi:transducin (beta)-like 1
MTSLKQHFGGSRVQGDMTSIDWNCDGSLLAMGSYDSVLRIANASGDLYMKDRTHKVSPVSSRTYSGTEVSMKGPIFATKFSKNSRWLLTASLDGTVCLWSVWEKKLHMQYKCHTGKQHRFNVMISILTSSS